MARTYSIGEISPVPERHECQLPNAPKNIENAQILGENEPKLYEGVGGGQSIEFLNTIFIIIIISKIEQQIKNKMLTSTGVGCMTWRLSEGGGGGKAIGEVSCGNGEVCQDFAKSAGFPAKKCEPKCESSLPKCESHLPKL